MANLFELDVRGDREIRKRMRHFPDRLRKKVLARSARKAMKIVLDDARATARAFDDPNTPPMIWKLIVIKQARIRESGVRMRIGIAGGAKSQRKNKDHPWYWRLLEFGTEKMKAQPFLRPALENNVQAVSDKFIAETNAEIDKLMAAPEP